MNRLLRQTGKIFITALLLVFIAGAAGTGAIAASGKGEVKEVFKEKIALCKVVAPYLDKCELKGETAASVATVEGTLPRSVAKGSVVLLKAAKAGKVAGRVIDCTKIDDLAELASKAAAEELSGKSTVIWIDGDGKRAALIQLDEQKALEPGEKIKVKAKRKAPVVEGC